LTSNRKAAVTSGGLSGNTNSEMGPIIAAVGKKDKNALTAMLTHRCAVLLLAELPLVCWEREFYARHQREVDAIIAEVIEAGAMM
jgi:hypothetical protein